MFRFEGSPGRSGLGEIALELSLLDISKPIGNDSGAPGARDVVGVAKP